MVSLRRSQLLVNPVLVSSQIWRLVFACVLNRTTTVLLERQQHNQMHSDLKSLQ